jgi:hypothetical protein
VLVLVAVAAVAFLVFRRKLAGGAPQKTAKGSQYIINV